MKYILPFLLLLTACNPLRHYTKVQQDPFRSNTELNILAGICKDEFPFKDSPATVIGETIDSTDLINYWKQVEIDYYKLVGEKNQTVTDTVTITVIEERIKELIKSAPPIIKTVTQKVEVLDTRTIQLKDSELNACRNDHAKLTEVNKEVTTQRNWFRGILIGVGIALVGGFLVWLRKVIRPV